MGFIEFAVNKNRNINGIIIQVDLIKCWYYIEKLDPMD